MRAPALLLLLVVASEDSRPTALGVIVNSGSPLLTVRGIRSANGGAHFWFPTVAGQHYQIESTTNLLNPAWIALTETVGTGEVLDWTSPASSTGDRRFYRVWQSK